MVYRGKKNGNLKPKTFMSIMEPATVKQTLSDPDWLEAMKAVHLTRRPLYKEGKSRW